VRTSQFNLIIQQQRKCSRIANSSLKIQQPIPALGRLLLAIAGTCSFATYRRRLDVYLPTTMLLRKVTLNKIRRNLTTKNLKHRPSVFAMVVAEAELV
jgi:hypothetical protein